MSNDKSREQFEAWVKDCYPNQSLERFNPLHGVTEGEYTGFTVQHCWIAWQASRSALVIELPRPYESAPPYACYEGGWNEMRGESVDAIEAAGLKVKP